MRTVFDIAKELKRKNVKLVPKDSLWYMRLADKLMFWNKDFMETYWTTIILGSIRVIAYPRRFKNRAAALKRKYTIIHELEHVKQADEAGSFWFNFKYLFLYFPAFGAWFRFKYEVAAYVKGYRAQIEGEGWVIKKRYLDQWVEWCATALARAYLAVPTSVARKRLKKELSDLYEAAS